MKDQTQFRIGIILIGLSCPWAISIMINSLCMLSNNCFSQLINLPYWITLPSLFSGIVGAFFVFTTEEEKEEKPNAG